MTAFRFEAVRPRDGGMIRGRLDVRNTAEGLAVLERRGLLAITLEPVPELGPRRTPNTAEQATALRSLASLVDACVPLASALRTTGRVVSGPLRETLERVETRVREGSPLGAALRSESTFSAVTVGLVQASESGSGTASGLASAADELEQRADSAARIQAALAYPVILLVVGGLSLVGILLFVVPKFASLLADVQATAPPLTRWLIDLSALFRQHALSLAGVLGAAAWAAALVMRTQRPRMHGMLHRLPFIGPVRHAMATARGARTLASLLSTGTPALRALLITQETVGDEQVAARLRRSRERVAEGAPLSAALADEAAFTELALQMAAIGDGAGRLPELLGRAAAMEARNAEHRVRSMVTVIEPLLIIVFGSVVALVAAALLQAVYSVRAGGM